MAREGDICWRCGAKWDETLVVGDVTRVRDAGLTGAAAGLAGAALPAVPRAA
jgi:hypothetical protein